MHTVLVKLSEVLKPECLVFHGHDYGVKNLTWANHLMENSDDSSAKQTINTAYQKALESKENRKASTGHVWRHETSVNLYVQASSGSTSVARLFPAKTNLTCARVVGLLRQNANEFAKANKGKPKA